MRYEEIQVGSIIQVKWFAGRPMEGWSSGIEKKILMPRDYKGPPFPRNNEEWDCEVLVDSKPRIPNKGYLLVVPKHKCGSAVTSWAISPTGPMVLGAQMPLLTKKVTVGSRTETTEWKKTDDVRQHLQDAGCPEGVRRRALDMFRDYDGALGRVRSAIPWPSLSFSADNLEQDMEVLGIAGKFTSCVSVTTDGVIRQMSWKGDDLESMDGPVQILTDKVRDRPESRYQNLLQIGLTELDELVRLFGQPSVWWSSMGPSCDPGWLGWGKLAGQAACRAIYVAVSPALFFERPGYAIELPAAPAATSDREVVVVKTTTSGGIDLPISMPAFERAAESQLYDVVSWDGREWATKDCARLLEDWRPVVRAARLSWACETHLTPDQKAEIFARAKTLPLGDHAVLFRTAVLRSRDVQKLRDEAEQLSGMAAVNAAETLRVVREWETYDTAPDPDKIVFGSYNRGGHGGTESIEHIILQLGPHKVELKKEGAAWTAFKNGMDAAAVARLYVEETTKRNERLLDLLTAEAMYEGEKPPYADAVSASSLDAGSVDAEAAELLATLETALTVAATRFAAS